MLTLTLPQVQQLARLAQREDSPAFHLRPFKCEVPGMVSVGGAEINLALLYPAGRPVPRDPLFQHAGEVSQHRGPRFMLQLQRGQLGKSKECTAYCLDAPDHMPAGSCVAFSYDEDVYGADQSTVDRESEHG